MNLPGHPLQSGRRPSAVEQVVNSLFNGLMSNRFAPGQRLIEADLTAEYGVSRGTLREAFRRLAADGLIEIVPNRGAIVRRLSSRDMNELFQIRTELEGLAARLAAERMADPELRARFETAIAPIWQDQPRTHSADYIAENAQFHEAILDASGNRQLALVSRQFQLPVIMAQVRGLLTVETMASSVAEHRRMARAILAGHAAEAERLMQDHLARAMELTRRFIDRQNAPWR
jgi:DNA-binding GntR family transcriptional regulator